MSSKGERNWLLEMEIKRSSRERNQHGVQKKPKDFSQVSQSKDRFVTDRRYKAGTSSSEEDSLIETKSRESTNVQKKVEGHLDVTDYDRTTVEIDKKRVQKILINDSFVVERFKINGQGLRIQGSSAADAWWNSTLNKSKAKDGLIWASWMGEPSEEDRALVEVYGRKPVRAGYRGFNDSKLSEKDSQSFEGIMEQYSMHVKLHDGRSNEAKVRRPDHLEDPKEAMKWIISFRSIATRLASSRVEERVGAVTMLADMSEDITEQEASDLVEKGVIKHLILLENEASNESVTNGVFKYLQSSKIGPEEQSLRYLFCVHISVARIFRNLFCLFSASFNLQPRGGNPNNDGISYDWLSTSTATFSDIILQHPGVYRLLLGLFAHECLECKLHAAFALLHVGAHSDKNKQLLLDTNSLQDMLLESLHEPSPEVQEAAIVLINSLLYCTRAKMHLYERKAPNGQSFISLVTEALNCGNDKTKEIAAWVIWALSDERVCESKLKKKKSVSTSEVASDLRGNLKGVSEWLGDEYQQDLVKYRICREPGLLEGLADLLMNGPSPAQEAAAAAVWCLAIERANKRRLGLQPGIVGGLSAILRSQDSSADSQRYASNAIRNLGTDPVALSYISSAEHSVIDHLMKDCDLSAWQVFLNPAYCVALPFVL